MTLLEKYYFMCLCLIFVLHIAVAGESQHINADYFWGVSDLRSNKVGCDQTVMRLLCYAQCGKKYICKNDECICNVAQPQNLMKYPNNPLAKFDDNKNLYSKEHDFNQDGRKGDETELDESRQKDADVDYLLEDIAKTVQRPALRHHIAHFCPNLHAARTCIRTCMKVGKPAFCGKDHVCYCGHRYTSHDVDKKVDVSDTYAQFRDLYEKYFGPMISDTDYSEEEEEEEEPPKGNGLVATAPTN